MQGFTLVEIIIAMAMFALILASTVAFILTNYDIYYFSFEQSRAVEEAQRAIQTMIKEIRRADIAENGNYVLEDTQDFQFIFYADVDKDDDVERVRYFIDDNFFKRGVVEPQGELADYHLETENIVILSAYVVNTPPVFRYFDGEGNELPAPARRRDTKLMRLTLQIDARQNEPPSAFTLISETQIRNLKTNL